MEKPVIDLSKPPKFTGKLHKKKNASKNKVTICGTNMSEGDSVAVHGTLGNMRQTLWSGTITESNTSKTVHKCYDLDVLEEEEDTNQAVIEEHCKKTGGSEDVSTTVTNTTGTSAPVTTIGVPTIP